MEDTHENTHENFFINLSKVKFLEIIRDDPRHDPKYVALYNKAELTTDEMIDFMSSFMQEYEIDSNEHIRFIVCDNLIKIMEHFHKYDFNNAIMNRCLFTMINLGSVKETLLDEPMQLKLSLCTILFIFVYKIYYDLNHDVKKLDEYLFKKTKELSMSIDEFMAYQHTDTETIDYIKMLQSLLASEQSRIKDLIKESMIYDSKIDYDYYSEIIAYGILIPKTIKNTKLQDRFNFVFLFICCIYLNIYNKTYLNVKKLLTQLIFINSDKIDSKLILNSQPLTSFKSEVIDSIISSIEFPKVLQLIQTYELSILISNELNKSNKLIEQEKVSKLIASIDNNFNVINGGGIFDKIKNLFKKLKYNLQL